MSRKLVVVLSLLVLAGSLTGVSFANNIQITLGPSTSGLITTTSSSANFLNVAGYALQGGGLGLGTFGFLNGNIAVTNVTGPTYTLAVNSEAVTINIGSDTLNGNFSLASFTQITSKIEIFVGTFTVTGATSGFANSGFPVGSVADADFVTYKGSLSSGELVPTVPEPGTIAMVGSGLLAMAGVLRRKL
jgi:hypothetical protein